MNKIFSEMLLYFPTEADIFVQNNATGKMSDSDSFYGKQAIENYPPYPSS
jgi:hypothetical protein